MIMEVPKDIEVVETKTGYIWEDRGVICNVSKENAPKLSEEENDKETARFLSLFGNKKHCILIDAKYTKPTPPEERKKAAKTLTEIVQAMAVIVHNPLGRMVVNLFIGLQKPPYPMKIYKPGEEEEAKEWLRTFLEVNEKEQ